MTDLRVASLFSGIGGMDLALKRVGIPTLLQCEVDAPARSVLTRHWPAVVRHNDIRELIPDDLSAAGLVPDRTVVAAGFPCQDVSVAGGRRGMGEGTRSGLYWHIVRLLAGYPAAWVVLENVPGLLSAGCSPPCPGGCVRTHGGAMGAVLGSLADLGYGFAWRVLDAQYFGVAQRRHRVVIVGNLGDSGAAPAQVLFESTGGGGGSAQVAETGEGTPGGATGVPGGRGVVGALMAHHGRNDAHSVAAGHRVAATQTGAGLRSSTLPSARTLGALAWRIGPRSAASRPWSASGYRGSPMAGRMDSLTMLATGNSATPLPSRSSSGSPDDSQPWTPNSPQGAVA